VTKRTVQRKLAALISADVAGYSRLMGDDEMETIKTLTTYRALMSNCIDQYHGRVVDSPGDNLLAEFPSVVDAIECAVEIQKKLETQNKELPETRRMEFRIGVNLGDVVQEGDSIFGDGVNITARMEGLAEAGGICISGTAYDQVKNKLNFGYEFLGKQNVKNISDPVRAYRVLTRAKDAGTLKYKVKKDDPKHKRRVRLVMIGILTVFVVSMGVWRHQMEEKGKNHPLSDCSKNTERLNYPINRPSLFCPLPI
jgi:adenylate cyclase